MLILLRTSQMIPCDSSAVTVELTDKTARAIKSGIYQWSGEVTQEARLLKDIGECVSLGAFSIPIPSSTERYELLLHMENEKEIEVICRRKTTKETVGSCKFNLS